jgi:hypothetical protein
MGRILEKAPMPVGYAWEYGYIRNGAQPINIFALHDIPYSGMGPRVIKHEYYDYDGLSTWGLFLDTRRSLTSRQHSGIARNDFTESPCDKFNILLE